MTLLWVILGAVFAAVALCVLVYVGILAVIGWQAVKCCDDLFKTPVRGDSDEG